MAKTVLLIALCLLPALAVASRPMKNPFIVEGKVYCDTCRAGFETSATTYIPGARIRIECVDRNAPSKVLFRKETTTDSEGCYSMLVAEDHGNQICDAVVVSSPQQNCAKAAPGRDRARVILTGYNGIASEKRFVNNIGFEMDEPLALCSNVLKQYQETEYEN
ncbi:major pollen allergen Lol p 11 [Morus notabilis]|uniref:major pollen allergen Lol p 11 n=1 Tax=Morus notabilis TaxID=981085 RepID=UPI000CED16B6|nr:major pollen allergen Lol p 11 [Morus notabilis]